jgi:hypothetical protein
LLVIDITIIPSLPPYSKEAHRKAGTATNSRLWNWLAVPGLPLSPLLPDLKTAIIAAYVAAGHASVIGQAAVAKKAGGMSHSLSGSGTSDASIAFENCEELLSEARYSSCGSLGMRIAAKTALDRGLSGWSVARRMLDPKHENKAGRIEAALRLPGKEAIVHISDAA